MIPAYPFELDRFQREAVNAVESGRSVLVAAPTSSGKTVIAEAAIGQALESARRTFYTAPIKALCNQKYRDLAALFGSDRVGLLTGDNSIAPWAQVVVMTTEVLRNMLYSDVSEVDDLAWVVLDEVHFLEDPYRGAVWEEVVLNLPAPVGIVALSATVSNADELGDWLSSVRGPTEVVVERRRPVPLRTHYLVAERQRGRAIRRLPLMVKGRPNPEGRRFDPPSSPRGNDHRRGGRRSATGRRWASPRRTAVATDLRRNGMLPAIHFVFSRKGCEEARDSLLRSGVDFNTAEEAQEVEEFVRRMLDDVPSQDLQVLGAQRWAAGLRRGVAAHHAGLLPLFKEVVERLFASGLLKVVYATETLALGVNLPARSVVIESLTKFDGEGHSTLTPGQFTQLTGRAGRRGIDKEGNALVCWSPFVPFAEVVGLATSQEFVLRSAFRPTYNMVANLVVTRTRAEAELLLSRSFGQFQMDRRTGKKRSLVLALEARLRVLEARGLADGWRLEPRGEPLVRVFNEADLLVVESLASGLLEGLGPADLAAVASCLTFRRRGRSRSEPPARKGEINRRILGIIELAEDLVAEERRHGVPSVEPPDPGFSTAIRRWAAGDDLSEVLTDEWSGGEFVRNIRLVADLLGQLAEVGTTSVARSARRAVGALERGVVTVGGAFDGSLTDAELGS